MGGVVSPRWPPRPGRNMVEEGVFGGSRGEASCLEGPAIVDVSISATESLLGTRRRGTARRKHRRHGITLEAELLTTPFSPQATTMMRQVIFRMIISVAMLAVGVDSRPFLSQTTLVRGGSSNWSARQATPLRPPQQSQPATQSSDRAVAKEMMDAFLTRDSRQSFIGTCRAWWTRVQLRLRKPSLTFLAPPWQLVSMPFLQYNSWSRLLPLQFGAHNHSWSSGCACPEPGDRSCHSCRSCYRPVVGTPWRYPLMPDASHPSSGDSWHSLRPEKPCRWDLSRPFTPLLRFSRPCWPQRQRRRPFLFIRCCKRIQNMTCHNGVRLCRRT